MDFDIQTLNSISASLIFITGTIFCFYVILAGCITDKKEVDDF